MVRQFCPFNSDTLDAGGRQMEVSVSACPDDANEVAGSGTGQPARLRVWLLAGLLASLAGSAVAQSSGQNGYLIESWASERGLPQNMVTGLAQTPDGYLWVSTLDGLARFDGMRFRIYKAGNTPALGSGRIRFLFPSRRGGFWLTTQEGGAIRFDNGRFSALALPESQGPRPAISQVAEDDANGLWLSTEEGKAARLADGKYSTISTNWDPSGKTAFQVRADLRGRLLAVTDTAVYHVNGTELVPALEGKRGELAVHCPSRGGGWWVSTGGQVRLWRDGQWLKTVQGPGLPVDSIRSALEDRNGRLWLGTWGQGLFRCDTNQSPLQLTKQDGLSSDFVRVLCEDTEGNLWAGTEGAGLSRLRAPLFTVYGLAEGLSWEWITSVSEGPTGDLWVGTDGYGLNQLQNDMIRPARDEPVVTPQHVMVALADRRGHIWLGTRQGGLYEWKEGAAKRVSGFPAKTSRVRSLFEDSQGAIWVGRHDTDELVRVHDGAVSTIALPKSLVPVDVRVMAEDESGALWIGTDGKGLLCWKEGKFKRYSREEGLSSDLIWALQPEADGALWIGTFGGGLTRLKNGHVATCATRQGLADDVICHIADDGRGQYWLGSHQGVFRVNKNELNQFANGTISQIHSVGYGKSDGLPTLECKGGFQPAGCRGRDGRLWFPTMGGVVVVDPVDASTGSPVPPVYVEEVFVDGQLFGPERWRIAERRSGNGNARPTVAAIRSSRPALSFPAGSRRFEFHCAGVSLGAPEQLRFRHKLEGVDADWVDTGARREASYTRLPHGAYTFRVQARNREGIWSQPGDLVAFRVLPFLWQTWWFLSLFLVTFGGTVGWGVGVALRRRHQRHLRLVEQLHAAERERTRIARDIHDDLGSSLTEISLLGALAVRESTPPGEAREQVARMMTRAEELTRKLDETVWAVNPKNDSLRHLATYLCNLAKEFLEPTPIRCRLDVPPDLPDVPLTTEVRHNVFLATKEALNNAVRHSGASEIRLRMAVGGGVLALAVADNGRGFHQEANQSARNGLRNMAERMEEIGGRLQVRSAAGQGTTVALELPLPGPVEGGESLRATQLGDATGGPTV
ncbi:MAG TPA: two-component regulator propeller domain-containing protein [Candidatus Paceibacterota bacterium]|nr:two-component regulator propeller domain-containing protein [Verrucomicrobiota bacterium]HSA09613.1 two-component regulator propeller domain-containing protein [Candidatus Paceibacterota bacterium]